MVSRVSWLLPAVAALVLAAACAPPAQAPAPAKPEAPAKQQPATADPEQLWEELAQAARAEGRVVIYTHSAEMRDRMGPAFTNRFGVDTEFIIGRAGDFTGRLEAERGAGVYSVDLGVTGVATTGNVWLPNGWLTPIEPMIVHPEALDLSNWRGGEIQYQDPERQYILRTVESVQNAIAYNPEVIDGEALIQVSDDLLRPELKGQMSTDDPTVAGSGSQTALYFLHFKGEDFVRELYVGQEVAIARDQRQVADWFARGTHPIMLTPREEDVIRLMDDGFEVPRIWPNDVPPMAGTGGGFVVAYDSAPHPNATKLFLNWLMTQEGQELFAEALGRVSMRLDVDLPEGIPAYLAPDPDVEYFSSDDWEFRTVNYQERLERISELVRP